LRLRFEGVTIADLEMPVPFQPLKSVKTATFEKINLKEPFFLNQKT